MDLKRLQHLLLLTEELHFSRAAQRANLSQTAFSRSIQTLERELGVRLFDRDTRRVSLTAAGRQIVARARELIAQATCLQFEVDELRGLQAGRLAFGVSQLVEADRLERLIEQLQPAGSEVRLDIEVNHWEALREALLAERIEFFVAYARPLVEDSRFVVHELPAQAASLFCRAQHPLLNGAAITPARLLDYPWSCVRFDASIAQRLCSLLHIDAAQLPVRLTCSDLGLLRRRLLASNELLLTWRQAVAAELASGQVVELPQAAGLAMPAEALALPCALVRLAGRTLSPLAMRAQQWWLANV
ncbi:LysR family transcriptional regulator [Pseudomonas sp. REST10]|uniref:LysR family transcriptional regulator n=1 Tax=Pseudomonas sp. REST10 TaxID=2512235 RepID=UPI00240DE892|nr:LysR family transcriptional regulator [Pseudomonas sp. REST10]WFC62287.1 LysR family transcriptional regulator [Pseudomonas sp. REST10]